MALAAALLLAGCGAGGEGSSAGDGGEAKASGGKESGGQTAELGTPALGSADAPVVLTEYSDYQ